MTHSGTQNDCTMHTCLLCGEYTQLPCMACIALYADDMPLDQIIQWTDDDYNQEMDDYYN